MSDDDVTTPTEVPVAETAAVAHGPDVVTLTREEFEALKAAGEGPKLYDFDQAARDKVTAAEKFVAKVEAHLAGARASLEEAQAELTAQLAGEGVDVQTINPGDVADVTTVTGEN